MIAFAINADTICLNLNIRSIPNAIPARIIEIMASNMVLPFPNHSDSFPQGQQ